MEELFLAGCNEGALNVCNKLIKKEVNVNCVDANGQSGLIKACANGHIGVVKLLLRSKANINLADNYGQNALYYAIKARHIRISKILCIHHIDAKHCLNYSFLKPRDLCLETCPTDPNKDSIESKLYALLLNYERGVSPTLTEYDSDDDPPKDVIMYEKKKAPKKRKNKKGTKKAKKPA